jgi:hypothetical protein
MPLIQCPDCSASVSDKAPACPKCACPLGVTAPIEQTAKRWKAIQAADGAVLAAGACLAAAGAWYWTSRPTTFAGIAVAAVGLTAYAGGRVAAWWHHG